MPPPRATESAMRRALSVWMDKGLPVAGMEVMPDGTIRILASSPEPRHPAPQTGRNSCDDLFGGAR